MVTAAPFALAQEQMQVSRLPPLPQPLDPILQDMFDKRRAMGGDIINLTITTGHAPKFARASGVMALTIRFETSTPRRLIELVIFRTAQIVGSNYELNQHTPLMKMCGYTDQQIGEIANWQRSATFDDKQRAALGYVEQMAHGGNVDDPTFAELSRLFTPQQIVEISYTVGTYYGTGLLTKALKIQPETDGRLTVPGQC
ncbi:MAG: carboxymuconolactone decarboxylase family protein [Xanthobacteraceae bacterium]|nr:carboxymuconolactone decarboxylase family protein [Xanthobacteraceae bacterium]